jgi:gliding motility-associated-like protein
MKRIIQTKNLLVLVLATAFMMLNPTTSSAQSCNPSFSGAACEGSIISFFANAPGYNEYEWDWNHDGLTSSSRDPKHAFPKAGTYVVKFTAKDKGGILPDCSKTLSVTVKESPKPDLTLISQKDQCFNGNEFCFADSSKAATGSQIVRVSYLFSDAHFEEFINPTFPRKICHKFADKRGGYFDLIVELEDKNGCVTKVTYKDVLRVWPHLGVELNSNAPIGCDSTLATITNQTYIKWLQDPNTTIGLKDIAQFKYEFGDGEVIIGDSNTNKKWWTGEALNGKIKHMYRTNGLFNATLTVTSKFGCSEVFTYRAAATNYKYKPQIIHNEDSTCTSTPEVKFGLKGGPIQGTSGFLWNFGHPPSGNLNTNNQTWTPTHNYPGGPWMISLRIVVGPCDLQVYDTIWKVGPSSGIETIGVRILEKEKYQCQIKDSVHFTNISTFYHGDHNYDDEDVIEWVPTDSTLIKNDSTVNWCMDSVWTVPTDSVVGTATQSRFYLDSSIGCGKPKVKGTLEPQIETWTMGPNFVDLANGQSFYTAFATRTQKVCRDSVFKSGTYFITETKKTYKFNFDTVTRTGDQTALPRTPSIRLKENIFRLWTLGDQYAPQCTTDMRINKNVGINCNFTEDTLPVHWYTPWEQIYKEYRRGQFYATGSPKTLFSRNGRRCTRVQVYPSDTMIVPQEVFVIAPLESNYSLNILYKDSITGGDSVEKVKLLANTTYPRREWRKNYRLILYRPPSVYHGPIIHTVIIADHEFQIPTGVTIKVKNLNNGQVVLHTGPKTLTIETDYQFEIEKGDSIMTNFRVETETADTTYAAASTWVKDTVINGIDSFVTTSEKFIDSAYHRTWFYQNRAQCNSVTLFHKDTVHPYFCESTANVSLALIPPNARGLKWEAGNPCVVAPGEPFNPSKYLIFAMDETKPGCTQQWFEVNYDSLSGKNMWFNYKSGSVLAPPPPGVPDPFILPYLMVGSWGTKFIKAYSPNEVDNEERNTLKGSFTLGLIIGNGPPQFDKDCNPIAPECVDTAWYHDMFRIKFMDPAFEMLFPNKRDWMCAGDTAYIRMQTPVQEAITTFAVFWSSYDGSTTHQGRYFEETKYFEDYLGPRSYRNDKDITWNGETDWKYDYSVRNVLTYINNNNKIQERTTQDTLVRRIYHKYAVAVNTFAADKIIEDAFKNIGLDLRDIPAEDVPLYLGNPQNPSCIDTTGIGQYFKFYYTRITKDTVSHGNFVYQYNKDKSDSTLIEEVLHFRDSSWQGYDTAIAPFDVLTKDSVSFKKGSKIPGLYQLVYKYPVLIPDPCDPNITTLGFKDVTGIVNTVVYIENSDGCQTSNSFNLKVGFFHQEKLVNKAVCMDDVHRIRDSIRYWTDNDLLPTYPVDPTIYWEDPARYAKIEHKSVDWDLNDGKEDFEKSIVFTHVYDTPGQYIIRLAMEDSNKCRDTASFVAFVTGVKANFEINTPDIGCNNFVSFFDSTVVFDPCRGADTCADAKYEPCDSIIKYEWDFGDGSRTSFLKDPVHDYTSNGWFTVHLKVWTLLGCEDTISKHIFIAGPQPGIEFTDFNPAWGPDTFKVCLGDPIGVTNKSVEPVTNPRWEIDWGDSTTGEFNTIQGRATHTYKSTGTYYIYLDMEDEVAGTQIRCKRVAPDTSTKDGKEPRKIVVIVVPVAPADFVISDEIVCPNDLITFSNRSDTIYKRYTWQFGDGDTITRNYPDTTIVHAYAKSGVYNIAMIPDYDLAIGDFGPKCQDTAFGKVTVIDVVADFDIIDTDKPNFCFKNTSTNARLDNLKWTFQTDPDDKTIVEEKSGETPCHNWGDLRGTFEVCLFVESPEGCFDTICKTVENDLIIRIVPFNVFTPDKEGDIYNSHFVVDVEGHEEFEIKIYNRWGELVFESEDPTYSWDGTVMNKGRECPEGTYFYVINYRLKTRNENDDLEPISGTVTLIRD